MNTFEMMQSDHVHSCPGSTENCTTALLAKGNNQNSTFDWVFIRGPWNRNTMCGVDLFHLSLVIECVGEMPGLTL